MDVSGRSGGQTVDGCAGYFRRCKGAGHAANGWMFQDEVEVRLLMVVLGAQDKGLRKAMLLMVVLGL